MDAITGHLGMSSLEMAITGHLGMSSLEKLVSDSDFKLLFFIFFFFFYFIFFFFFFYFFLFFYLRSVSMVIGIYPHNVSLSS